MYMVAAIRGSTGPRSTERSSEPAFSGSSPTAVSSCQVPNCLVSYFPDVQLVIHRPSASLMPIFTCGACRIGSRLSTSTQTPSRYRPAGSNGPSYRVDA